MIRSCPNDCDVQEKDIAQACCEISGSFTVHILPILWQFLRAFHYLRTNNFSEGVDEEDDGLFSDGLDQVNF